MNTGILTNLIVTTAVQTAIGGIIATIIRRYVAQVDRLATRLRELEEKRMARIEAAWDENQMDHERMHEEIAYRMSRDDQKDFLSRIERVSDEQRTTAIQQARTAEQMSMAATQITELFGRVTILSRDVSRMQGRIEKVEGNS